MYVGILHPGAMGSLVGATCSADVYWASSDRSSETAARAAKAGLTDAGHLGALVGKAEVVVSVCPPHAALEVATQVAGYGFAGVYVDANAVSPATARDIGARFERFVDGGIVGPPPATSGTTRLYLSGEKAESVFSLWEGSALEPRLLEGPIGTASALKMAYAGWTKGSSALLLAVRAYAEALGVGDALTTEWEQSIPELPGRVERMGRSIGSKAWRFEGEMEQIAQSLAAEDLPAGFHEAAVVIYSRLAELKSAGPGSLEDVLDRLTDAGPIQPGSH